VSAGRKALLFTVLFLLGMVLCAGDNHVCVQSGPCFGCLHGPVWIPAPLPVGEAAVVDFGFTSVVASPKTIPLQLLREPSLRAPPQTEAL
jgi:hypothetical protein